MFKGLMPTGQPHRLTLDDGRSEIVRVTLTPADGDGRVRRVQPGVVMSHEELLTRLGRKSWTVQTIEA